MCNKCLIGLNIPTKGRNDLSTTEEYDAEEFEAEIVWTVSKEEFQEYDE